MTHTINQNVAKRASRIISIAKDMAEQITDISDRYSVLNRLDEIQLHFHGYAERGYDTGTSRIVATCNWNDVDKYVPACKGSTHGSRVDISDLPSRICKLYEKMGIEVEWSDEWTTCSNCEKLVRTQPDSYSWQASFIDHNGECLCHECVKADSEDYLSSLEGNYRTANTISDINPKDFGYVKIEECESGWHNSHDNPKDVAKKVEAKGVERYLFNIDSCEQFRTLFSLWIHESEQHLLEPEAFAYVSSLDMEDCVEEHDRGKGLYGPEYVGERF